MIQYNTIQDCKITKMIHDMNLSQLDNIDMYLDKNI